ncbi:hypothetical protein A2973_03380 [Candidatus Gottesmanbacteria bacterium RIFCSPLOWO2_01_FULL_49_10]|uniref:Uncharacterized protein n=1 Tax=Candidatus Gottesmanbacteria bacterium RIFCSPLOWO2_01_FULL_49_10 TaxID=1798396 RepID=A0A1F6B035_9BACT|nr:MAG: hypothetical protein UY10_C0021G0004 [Microgenomates group bacterium GW2011_GWA2_47_8]OGG30304.1 MAG: hypothetical protein A2973_03380 [Candidatus Gottesmanbacteria bacterium RIFCSPLOWO2_01_FULL_49_10]
MKGCERQFGGLTCSKLGDGICAYALNDAWVAGGDVRTSEPIVELLTEAGFDYALKTYLLHSYDQIIDARVKAFLHPSYVQCVAKQEIAAMAKSALEILTGDELPDLETLGQIMLGIYESLDA